MRRRRIAFAAFGVEDASIDEKQSGKQWTRVQADVVHPTTRLDVINFAGLCSRTALAAALKRGSAAGGHYVRLRSS